ncbi:Envelope glycoprotein gp160 [Dionaea muscipula]
MAAAATPLLLALAILAISTAAVVSAHNITEILSHYPEYSQFNDYLTRTRLADDINSRDTVTVLVVNNANMASLTANHPLPVIKNLLSLQVILDYYDPKKLHSISDGTTLTTTLYQTTGNAPGNLGFVNITDLKGGNVGFGSAVPGSKLDATYTKSVKQIGYNISVLEISKPITAPAILTAPAPTASTVNVTALLDKAGCKTFVALLSQSGVLKVLESQIQKGGGLTVFAPNDEAFKAKGVPDLSKLSNAELVSLLQYHALNGYSPKGTLKATKNPISTLATNGAGKFDLMTSSHGDDVEMNTGIVSSRVASTVVDYPPLVIFTVDNVLLPVELFGKAPSPAPAPAPAFEAPSPAPVKAPSPAPAAEAPVPIASPPAPPTETPATAPADAPSDKSENIETSKNAAGEVRAPALIHAASFVSAAIALAFLS